MTRDVHLYVGVASARDWKCRFGSSMVGLAWHLGTNQLNGRLASLEVKVAAQACLLLARQQQITDAMERGFTHFLFLDDDMVFPADIVERLLAHDKDIVCGNYVKKDTERSIPVCLNLDGSFCTSDGKSGLEEIGWTNVGMTLIRLAALKEIPAPHFGYAWNEARQDFWTEDYVFSIKMREHGVRMWCDHDVSREIGHVGDVEYRFPALPKLKVAA